MNKNINSSSTNNTLFAKITKFNKAFVGGNMVMVIILAVLALLIFWQPFTKQSSSSQGIISRATSDKLKSLSLISTETEDSFLEMCRNYELPKVNNDPKIMARRCGCEYEAIADISIGKNQKFTSVLDDISSGKLPSQNCEYIK